MKKTVDLVGGARINTAPVASRIPKNGEAGIFRFRYSIAFLFLLVLLAIVAYHFLEGWDFLDSAYFATTAITTMGSDIHPQTVAGKIFTIFYLWGGVALGFYLLMRIAPMQRKMIEGRMRRAVKFMRRK